MAIQVLHELLAINTHRIHFRQATDGGGAFSLCEPTNFAKNFFVLARQRHFLAGHAGATADDFNT